MRRLLGNASLVAVVFAFLAVVRRGWEQLAALSAGLGSSDSRFVDATIGWAPIGGLLVLVGVLPFRRPGSRSTAERVLVGLLLLPWAVLAATYLWTPLAGDRAGWLDDLSAGGEAFSSGVVASHWALAGSVVLFLVLAVAQVVSPRWQPGDAVNERRSTVAWGAGFAGPSLTALLLVWIS